jgi:energy-coupling factor transporter ATP-binding protein EcfA2
VRITNLRVQNYRGLRDLSIPLSRFACFIGENNAGKSTFLQAISLFFSGSSLAPLNFYDVSKDIRIAVTLADITKDDLSLLVEEHRGKIAPIVKSGSLTIVRHYGVDGKSRLRYVALSPKEARFDSEKVSELLKGKKPGAPMVAAVTAVFPELKGKVANSTNQGEVKDLIKALADGMPADQKEEADLDLPTGLDKSIIPMLPEVIYIPAVKDLGDEIKTKESTPFGKVLGILLKEIDVELTDEKQLFERLQGKLNRVQQADGSVRDDRLPGVKRIEQTVERFLKESFSKVSLELVIPPPEMKTVLSGAQIWVNDGVKGLVETKGDGLKRAVVFAILRSYVELNKAEQPAEVQQREGRYILLFEEPELYLHPKAQQILFAALDLFSKRHHVVVTTHSPLFFAPGATATFVKLRKNYTPPDGSRPHTLAYPIDVSDMKAKDQFQIICYENNNIAFFSDTVVLVEGDSDLVVFPHAARLVNPEWDCNKAPVTFARIGGKGSIRRYKAFFERFGAKVSVITDLDALVSGFDKLDAPTEVQRLRDGLLSVVDEHLDASGTALQLNGEDLRSLQDRGDAKAAWARARAANDAFKTKQGTFEQLNEAVEAFFSVERKQARLDALRTCPTPDVAKKKKALLAALRQIDVFVLEKGVLEDYYGPEITGDDKPSRAQKFVEMCRTKQAVEQHCVKLLTDGHIEPKSEFEVIFQRIFDGAFQGQHT